MKTPQERARWIERNRRPRIETDDGRWLLGPLPPGNDFPDAPQYIDLNTDEGVSQYWAEQPESQSDMPDNFPGPPPLVQPAMPPSGPLEQQAPRQKMPYRTPHPDEAQYHSNAKDGMRLVDAVNEMRGLRVQVRYAKRSKVYMEPGKTPLSQPNEVLRLPLETGLFVSTLVRVEQVGQRQYVHFRATQGMFRVPAERILDMVVYYQEPRQEII